MRTVALLSCLCAAAMASAADPKVSPVPAALDFEVQSLDGRPVKLGDYAGKVLVVVNVASECGATPQYADLQSLYQQHQDAGLVVLGFPCNQFGGQEPGSAAQIKEFCTKEYQVTFPMFAKIDVNGENAAPFYKHLTSQATKPKGQGKIGWNFEKFVIGKSGEVAARFPTGTAPSDPAFTAVVQSELQK